MKNWKNETSQTVREEYNGFVISVNRSFSLAGFPTTYYTVVRQSDGWFLLDDFTEGEDGLDVIVGICKKRINEHLKGKKK